MTRLQFIRTVRLAAVNFLGNGKRNSLSISTVVLGSLAICAVFTINDNVEVYVDSLINRSGGPNLFLSKQPAGNTFAPSEIQEIAAITSSRYVSIESEVMAFLRSGEQAHEVRLAASDGQYLQARPYRLIKGQFISLWDEEHPSNNIVISPAAAESLKLKRPIGSRVSIYLDGVDVVARVIGVAQPLYDTNDRGSAWISPSLLKQIDGSKGVSNLIAGFTAYSKLDHFEQSMIDTFEKDSESLLIYNPRSSFEKLRSEYGTFTQAGLIIGMLSLFAGAIGVMNMMMMGISLRSKEIGLYRALGFSKAVVLLNFLSETFYIVGTGGLVGAVLGSILGIFIAGNVVDTPVFVSTQAFFLSLSISTIIGLIFAYFPAKKAASMTAVEALRR